MYSTLHCDLHVKIWSMNVVLQLFFFHIFTTTQSVSSCFSRAHPRNLDTVSEFNKYYGSLNQGDSLKHISTTFPGTISFVTKEESRYKKRNKDLTLLEKEYLQREQNFWYTGKIENK